MKNARHITSPSFRYLTRGILIVFIALSSLAFLGCNPIPVPNNFDPRFYPIGAQGTNGAFQAEVFAIATDPRSEMIYIGGSFIAADQFRYNGVAAHTGDTYVEFDGLAGTVYALAISGDYLYAGGSFSASASGTPGLNCIARRNIRGGSESSWEALADNGLTFTSSGVCEVRAIAVSGTDLFVGGFFDRSATGTMTTLNRVARYNTTANGSWSPLTHNGMDNGLNGVVRAFQVRGGELFVGGDFTATQGGIPLGYIARYDFTTVPNSWSRITNNGSDNGLNAPVRAFALHGTNDLYVGGDFTGTFNASNNSLFKIGLYTISAGFWSDVENGLNSDVNSMLIRGNDLFVAGSFTADGLPPVTVQLNRIAKIELPSGSTWRALDNGINGNYVSALGAIGDKLYVGGNFIGTCGPVVGQDICPALASVEDLISYDLSVSPPNAENKSSGGSNWEPAGYNNSKALNEGVAALATHANGFIYVGGSFTGTQDGTTTLNRIARHDPSTNTWSPLANGGLNGGVGAIVVRGDHLYVGGSFSQTADGAVTNLNRLARYDLTTNTWSPVAGNGLNNFVLDMALSGDNLFVGGFFTATHNGATTGLNGVARYNVVTNTWSPFANNGVNGLVLGTVLSGDDLFVTGSFTATSTGGIPISNIARYNTLSNTWSALPNNGLNSFAGNTIIFDNNLWINGNFSRTGDNTVIFNGNLAMFNIAGNQWVPISSNAELMAAAKLASTSLRFGNDLYVGGSFMNFNNGVARSFTSIYLQQWKTMAGTADWHTATNWATESVPVSGTNAVIPVGSGSISITSADVTLRDLMHNGGTLTVGTGRTLTINGMLGLNGGVIDGDGTVVVTNCSADGILRTREASYIRARLVRCVNNSDAFVFPVGTANGYSPIIVREITGTGNVSVKANQGAYSNPATGLPANRSARWWQIENPGGGITSSNIVFGYREADIAGTEADYKAYRISGGTATQVNGSANTFANRVTATGVTGFSDWALAPGMSTAAPVSVSGRALTAEGRGITNAVMTITDQSGNQRTARTGRFGTFRFEDLTAGETYILTVRSRRFSFETPSQVIQLVDNLDNVDFVASPPQVKAERQIKSAKALRIKFKKPRSNR